MAEASGRKLNRRQALAGAAVLAGAAAIPYPSAASDPSTMQLLELGSELERLRRRITRLHRRVRRLAAAAERAVATRRASAESNHPQQLSLARTEIGHARAWRDWSTAVDRSLRLAAQIRSLPAHDLAGWSVKYQALLWELFEHEPSPPISGQQLRLLRRLGRELQCAGA